MKVLDQLKYSAYSVHRLVSYTQGISGISFSAYVREKVLTSHTSFQMQQCISQDQNHICDDLQITFCKIGTAASQ